METLKTQQALQDLLKDLLTIKGDHSVIRKVAEEAIAKSQEQLEKIKASLAEQGIEMPKPVEQPKNMTTEQTIFYAKGVMDSAINQLGALKASGILNQVEQPNPPAPPAKKSWWRRIFS